MRKYTFFLAFKFVSSNMKPALLINKEYYVIASFILKLHSLYTP